MHIYPLKWWCHYDNFGIYGICNFIVKGGKCSMGTQLNGLYIKKGFKKKKMITARML